VPVSSYRHESDGSAAFTSLTTTMRAAVCHLPEALVGCSARAHLDRITDHLPAALTRRTYLECRVADGASRVDFVLCVDGSSRQSLIDASSTWLPSRLRAHPLWLGLGRVSSEWADSGSSAAAHVHDLWLEFDTEGRTHGCDALVPNVFVGLTRDARVPVVQLWAAARRCLEALGQPLDRGIAGAAREIALRVPRGARLGYVGLMYPRGQKAIRLCLTPMRGATLCRFLEAIGWRVSVQQLEALLQAIPDGRGGTAWQSTTLLHLDVDYGVQPRLGLEIALQTHPQVIDALAERGLLDALCDRGLCAASKRDALLRWPGHAVEHFAHQCWPSLAIRWVGHLKILWDPVHGPEVKAYLAYFHGLFKRPRGGRS